MSYNKQHILCKFFIPFLMLNLEFNLYDESFYEEGKIGGFKKRAQIISTVLKCDEQPFSKYFFI